MAEVRTTALMPDTVFVSAAELAEIIGTDLETVNNWIRRGIITRTPIGRRPLRNRLFSKEEVYKTALKNELVKLGISPSPASDVVNTLWKDWDGKEPPDNRKLYAVVLPKQRKVDGCLVHTKEIWGTAIQVQICSGAANRWQRWICLSRRLRCFRFPPF